MIILQLPKCKNTKLFPFERKSRKNLIKKENRTQTDILLDDYLEILFLNMLL